jgi:hypothetical protein
MGLLLFSFSVPPTFDADALAAQLGAQIGEPWELALREEDGVLLGSIRCGVLVDTVGLVWHGACLDFDVDDPYLVGHLQHAMRARGATMLSGPKAASACPPSWRKLSWPARVSRTPKGAGALRTLSKLAFPLWAPLCLSVEVAVLLLAIVVRAGAAVLHKLGRPR